MLLRFQCLHVRCLAALLALALPPLSAAQATASAPADEGKPPSELQNRIHELQRAARAQRSPARPPQLSERPNDLIGRAVRFLLATQESDGSWAARAGPGVTALVVRALVQEPALGPEHEAVRRGLEFILRHRRDDGGIYGAEGLYKNYESSVALALLSALPAGEHRRLVESLQAFLVRDQWDESEDIARDNPFYGGAGYGRGKRPDLSNTQMMVEALHDSGLPKDDPAYQKALLFIQRCQMLGESNDQRFAAGSTQGGFIYSPVNGGESKAGEITLDGRTELRCYGSMTYAGFKSMLYAGLSQDDPRVRAAYEWIRRNWTLNANPNMPDRQSREGLFYFYHVLARALSVYGEDVITDAAGVPHHWRRELVEQLRKLQRDDGSWLNEEDRWMEGDAALVTAYALLALQAAFPAGS